MGQALRRRAAKGDLQRRMDQEEWDNLPDTASHGSFNESRYVGSGRPAKTTHDRTRETPVKPVEAPKVNGCDVGICAGPNHKPVTMGHFDPAQSADEQAQDLVNKHKSTGRPIERAHLFMPDISSESEEHEVTSAMINALPEGTPLGRGKYRTSDSG